jgi:hypothetical protein
MLTSAMVVDLPSSFVVCFLHFPEKVLEVLIGLSDSEADAGV